MTSSETHDQDLKFLAPMDAEAAIHSMLLEARCAPQPALAQSANKRPPRKRTKSMKAAEAAETAAELSQLDSDNPTPNKKSCSKQVGAQATLLFSRNASTSAAEPNTNNPTSSVPLRLFKPADQPTEDQPVPDQAPAEQPVPDQQVEGAALDEQSLACQHPVPDQLASTTAVDVNYDEAHHLTNNEAEANRPDTETARLEEAQDVSGAHAQDLCRDDMHAPVPAADFAGPQDPAAWNISAMIPGTTQVNSIVPIFSQQSKPETPVAEQVIKIERENEGVNCGAVLAVPVPQVPPIASLPQPPTIGPNTAVPTAEMIYTQHMQQAAAANAANILANSPHQVPMNIAETPEMLSEQLQMMHTPESLETQTKYTGVRKNKGGRFSARIKLGGVNRYLGSFATAEEAARAFDAMAIQNGRPVETLNFPAAYGGPTVGQAYRKRKVHKLYVDPAHQINVLLQKLADVDRSNPGILRLTMSTLGVPESRYQADNKYSGVRQQSSHWETRIRYKDKLYSMGFYASVEAAALAWDITAASLQRCRKLNFPEVSFADLEQQLDALKSVISQAVPSSQPLSSPLIATPQLAVASQQMPESAAPGSMEAAPHAAVAAVPEVMHVPGPPGVSNSADVPMPMSCSIPTEQPSLMSVQMHHGAPQLIQGGAQAPNDNGPMGQILVAEQNGLPVGGDVADALPPVPVPSVPIPGTGAELDNSGVSVSAGLDTLHMTCEPVKHEGLVHTDVTVHDVQQQAVVAGHEISGNVGPVNMDVHAANAEYQALSFPVHHTGYHQVVGDHHSAQITAENAGNTELPGSFEAPAETAKSDTQVENEAGF